MLWWIVFCIGCAVGYILWYVSAHHKRKSDECDVRRMNYHGRGYPIPSNIHVESSWGLNSRGMLLHRRIFQPKSENISNIHGVILLCHGYGDHICEFVTEIAIKFCSHSYIVITMDAEGHGLSDGLHGHIESVESIASDYNDFLIEQSKRFPSQSFYIYGGSMGGAVAFYLSTIFPSKNIIKGVILASPMVKISDHMRPHPVLITILSLLGRIIPYAPIVPLSSIIHKCFKRKDNLLRSLSCLLAYKQSPRLYTSMQLLQATDNITKRMNEFQLPLLIIHGEDDHVTCYKNSLLLYNTCLTDINEKKCNIYEGAWHSLLVGEEEPLASQIFQDIIQWLDERRQKLN